jgi:acyl dehydratase
MSLPTKHVLSQGRVVASIGGTAITALLQRAGLGAKPGTPLVTPSAEIVQTIPPLPADLVRDYVRNVGGDPNAYKKNLPPHLFPQWGFPLAAKTLKGIPYPLMKVLNGGCRIEINGPLPIGEKLTARARLEDIDDDGRRAVLHQKVVTGTAKQPDALVAHMYAIVPVEQPKTPGEKKSGKSAAAGGPARPKKESPRVPTEAREIAFWKLAPDAGLAFAMLTGDFNPVHWVKPYAKAFGFKSTILHGFATMARAYEGLSRYLYAGSVDRLKTFDVKFTRPLVLPARVGLYVDGHNCFVGDAPGGPAYLVGTFEEK